MRGKREEDDAAFYPCTDLLEIELKLYYFCHGHDWAAFMFLVCFNACFKYFSSSFQKAAVLLHSVCCPDKGGKSRVLYCIIED